MHDAYINTYVIIVGKVSLIRLRIFDCFVGVFIHSIWSQVTNII